MQTQKSMASAKIIQLQRYWLKLLLKQMKKNDMKY